jgi:hypothetical protein
MKKLFMSIGHWWFGKKKGVEVTAPLKTPTMKVVKPEPQEDKVEAILNGNYPEPQFMDIEESSEMLYQEEQLQEKYGYEPLKFEVEKDGQTYSLTEKQFVFYTIIKNAKKARGVDICKGFLEFKNPTGVPQNLPYWRYNLSSHKTTMAYLFKSGLIKKTGKFYSIK